MKRVKLDVEILEEIYKLLVKIEEWEKNIIGLDIDEMNLNPTALAISQSMIVLESCIGWLKDESFLEVLSPMRGFFYRVNSVTDRLNYYPIDWEAVLLALEEIHKKDLLKSVEKLREQARVLESEEVEPLTVETIKKIIMEHASKYTGINKIGLVGSRARGDGRKDSDVDLVFDLEGGFTQELIEIVTDPVEKVFEDKYRVTMDVILYERIFIELKRLRGNKSTSFNQYYREGYERMLKDIIWLWEAEKNIDS